MPTTRPNISRTTKHPLRLSICCIAVLLASSMLVQPCHAGKKYKKKSSGSSYRSSSNSDATLGFWGWFWVFVICGFPFFWVFYGEKIKTAICSPCRRTTASNTALTNDKPKKDAATPTAGVASASSSTTTTTNVDSIEPPPQQQQQQQQQHDVEIPSGSNDFDTSKPNLVLPAVDQSSSCYAVKNDNQPKHHGAQQQPQEQDVVLCADAIMDDEPSGTSC